MVYHMLLFLFGLSYIVVCIWLFFISGYVINDIYYNRPFMGDYLIYYFNLIIHIVLLLFLMVLIGFWFNYF